jgi:hypothetical protein
MPPHSVRKEAIKYGYRSGLEHAISLYLKEHKHKYSYESIKIEWEDLTYRTYTPDFILNNGIIIETKGRFLTADRKKHLCIRKQHPTYAQWCFKHDFRYYDRIIPEDWLKEKGKNKHPSFIKFTDKKIKRS